MSNIQTRSTLGDLGQRGLGPLFEDVFDQNALKYSGMDNVKKVVDFISTDKGTVRTTGLTGYGFLSQYEEGDAVPLSTNIKTFETVYAIKDYGRGVVVTEDCLDDREKLGEKLDEFAGLASSASITKAKHAMMLFNNAFSASTANGGVGSIFRYNSEALVTTSHARADGGSAQSNRSATNITLTELNLETGRLQLVKLLTDNGMPIIDLGRITLVVPDDLEKTATILVGSPLRPSTANNDLNFYRGIQMDSLSSRWLNAASSGSATQWFLVARMPGGMSPLRVYQREETAQFYQSEKEAYTGNTVFRVKCRYAVGNREWKTVFGSDGTGV